MHLTVPCILLLENSWILISLTVTFLAISKICVNCFCDFEFTLFDKVDIVNVGVTFRVDSCTTLVCLDLLFLHQVEDLDQVVLSDVRENRKWISTDLTDLRPFLPIFLPYLYFVVIVL